MSVKVAVRVRPFNAREKSLNCTCVVDMENPTTILKPTNGEAERKFTFDYSFWSFDGFQEDANKVLKPLSGSKYADQQYVYKEIGTKILDNAWAGYHCCLFAYGQTGSGKSYSMIGFGTNKGIVPITCNEIFERASKKVEGLQYQVAASMLQIYNEEIQDLTIDISKRPAGGLKIRQNKLLGVYVEGATKHVVSSYNQIQKVMDEGTKNRTVAATQMNATSSRAHTIITIQFKQVKKVGNSGTQKLSVINLVDLAGSQRQDKTGATGQRLKEAVGINQSLTSLGQVISILAENASGGKEQFVPYRNSALTRILQNALGGNSQTVMICAISPANDNYDQTLSTLRYADQAKKIKNKPIVNESQTDKLIRSLKQENERLKKLLEQKGLDPNQKISNQKKQQNKKEEEKKQQKKQPIKEQKKQPIKEEKKQTIIEEKKQPIKEEKKQPIKEQKKQAIKEQKKQPIKEEKNNIKKKSEKSQISESSDDDEDLQRIEAHLKALNEKIDQQSRNAQQRKQYQKKLDQEKKKADLNSVNNNILSYTQLKQREAIGKLPPYFENISRDFMLHRKLKILIQKDKLLIGKPGAKPPNDLIFGGRDIQPHHATIQKVQQRVLLTPLSKQCHLYRNGQKVTTTIQLSHLDRVIFGWNSVYLFKNKHDQKQDEKIQSKDIDWEFCKQQVSKLVDIDQSDDQDGGGCCEIM